MATEINTQINGDLSSSFFWETKGYDIGVFECWKDLPTCLGVYCCGPCSFGYVAGQLDGKGFSLPACCCPHVYAYRLRRETQEKFGIQEHGDAAMCGASLCALCTAIQDIHELEKRNAIKFLGGAHQQPAGQATMQA